MSVPWKEKRREEKEKREKGQEDCFKLTVWRVRTSKANVILVWTLDFQKEWEKDKEKKNTKKDIFGATGEIWT